MSTITRIAIVVGEASGDILGAGLMSALQKRYPSCVFEGIGGPRMQALGFQSHFSMERLAVMGLVEPLKRLPELLSIRKKLKAMYSANPPDVFVGIDAPDFNLTLEKHLKDRGVKTVHYVSPSVWAWRQGRVKKIAKSVDLMLTLFPFEAKFYEKHQINVKFVGHPLADQIPIETDVPEVREKLGLDKQQKVLAILPGSRRSEVEKLCRVFLQAARRCHKEIPDLLCLIPAANAQRREEIATELSDFADLNVVLSQGNSHEVMAAADVVLIASGTTALEAMLLKKPTVIAYRVANLTFQILKRLVKVQYIGLPNLLADESLVPELIQDEATAENIAQKLLHLYQDHAAHQETVARFTEIHQSIKKDASETAAIAVEKLCLER